MRLSQNYLEEQMQNEEFRAAYDEWEPDFQIAETLIQFRADNKLTQAELAKMIGINRSDLSKLESASANPTLKTLKKIGHAMGARLRLNYAWDTDLKASAAYPVANTAVSSKIADEVCS